MSAMLLERCFALLCICLENVIHGGIIFGWPSLVYIFKQLGYFSDMCSGVSENTTSTMLPYTSFLSNPTEPWSDTGRNISTSCDEQDAQLQLVYSITIASQTISMFLFGLFYDRFGTRLSRVLLSMLLLLGYTMTALSSPEYSFLLFPATIAFTLGGVLLLLSSMQVGNLFGNQKSTVIGAINGMYGGSVIVGLLIKTAFEAGFSFNTFFFLLVGGVVLMEINTLLFLPVKHIPWPLPDDYRLCKFASGRDEMNATKNQPDVEAEEVNGAYDNETFDEDERGTTHVNDTIVNAGRESEADARKTDRAVIAANTPGDEHPQQQTADGNTGEDRKQEEYSSLGSCILSVPFILLLIWQMFLEFDMIFTFGTLNFFLTELADGDEETVSWYTDVFSITQFFILIVGPLGGLLMDRNKLWTACRRNGKTSPRGPYSDMQDSCLPQAVTSLASVGYSICFLIPSLQLQYLAFILILILRSLLFGVGSAVVAVVFPTQYFASIYGAMRTITGCFTLLQYPLFIVLQKYLDKDPFYVTIGFIAADVVTLILPVFMYIIAKRRTQKTENKLIIPIT